MLKSIVIFTVSSSFSALAHASPELDRCAAYLEATTPQATSEIERLEAVERENSEVFRLLQRFRLDNLKQFEPEVSDQAPANGWVPSQELADRLFTIAHRDGFRLGNQDINETGFNALLTRVQAKRELGAGRIREVLGRRKAWLSGSTAAPSKSGVMANLFRRQLIDENTLEEALVSLQPGRWFYHSFDIFVPTEMAQELWRTHKVSPSAEDKGTPDTESSFLASLTKSFTNAIGGRAAQPSGETVVIRVDELLMTDRFTSEPILVTVIRLSEDTTTRSRPGGTSRYRGEVEEEVYDLAGELGLQPVPVIANPPPRRP